jgi:RNA polymerase sigma-70 factor, ECF subfamily
LTSERRHLEIVPAPAAAAPSAPLDDAALVHALRRGDSAAAEELFDRYGRYVERLLARVLGADSELADVLQEVFVRAYRAIHTIKDAAALKAWLTTLALFTARAHIRSRTRRSWLRFVDWNQLPEVPTTPGDPQARDTLLHLHQILDRIPADQRIAFVLRFVEGMELTEVAAACGVSLATIKRRLDRAHARFERLAHAESFPHRWKEGQP